MGWKCGFFVNLPVMDLYSNNADRGYQAGILGSYFIGQPARCFFEVANCHLKRRADYAAKARFESLSP